MRLSARLIIEQTAREHLVPVSMIMGPSRQVHVVRARHAAIRKIAEEYEWPKHCSLTWIAERLGLHYTSVLYVLKTAKRLGRVHHYERISSNKQNVVPVRLRVG